MAPDRRPGAGWDLDSLTLAAVYFHPDLDVAYAKLGTAKEGVVVARQRPNPILDLTGQYNTSPIEPPITASPWTVGLAINLLIETFGKRGYRIEQANHLVDAARDDIRTAAWQVRGRVRTALIDLWDAEQRRALAAARLEHEERQVTLLEHRRAVGETSALELARQRVSRDQSVLSVRAAESAMGAARADLAAAIGVPVAAIEMVQIDPSALGEAAASATSGPQVAPELRRPALTSRSDIQGALAAYAAADAGLRLQLAGRYPNLTLGPSYTYDQGDNKFGLAAMSLELPIFNRREGPIGEAAARRREAAASFLALQARAIAEIDAAATAERGADAGLAAAAALEAQQRARQARTRKTFEAGEIDRPALLAGEIELDAARQARLDAERARLKALGLMEDALQQPLLSPGVAFADVLPPPRRELEPTR